MRHIKVIAFFIFFALTICIIPRCYADKTFGDYKYRITSDGKAIITKYFGKEVKLRVPSAINNYEIIAIGSKAFFNCDGIQHVILPENILSIEEYAFAYCEDLVSITTSATHIGEYAFKYCENLVTLNCRAFETKIDEQAFYSCKSLSIITGIIQDPDEYAFAYCEDLKTIAISGKYIGNYAFKYCENLETVSIMPDNIVVKEQAFYSCKSLTTFTAVASDVEEYAFAYCEQLPEITVSGNIVGKYAFKYCNSLQTVSFLTPQTNISKQAFYSCEKLKTVSGVVGDIDEYGFAYCDKLTTLQFIGTNIGDNAFRYCNLIQLEIPMNSLVENAVKNANINYRILSSITSSPDDNNENLYNLHRTDSALWNCPTCGNSATGNYCSNCGSGRPVNDSTITSSVQKSESSEYTSASQGNKRTETNTQESNSTLTETLTSANTKTVKGKQGVYYNYMDIDAALTKCTLKKIDGIYRVFVRIDFINNSKAPLTLENCISITAFQGKTCLPKVDSNTKGVELDSIAAPGKSASYISAFSLIDPTESIKLLLDYPQDVNNSHDGILYSLSLKKKSISEEEVLDLKALSNDLYPHNNVFIQTSPTPTNDPISSTGETVIVKLSSGREITIRRSIKDTLEAYEVFMDDYKNAMEKIGEGDFTGYLSFMTQYEELMKKIEALEDDLTEDETWYYYDVTMRVLQKMY